MKLDDMALDAAQKEIGLAYDKFLGIAVKEMTKEVPAIGRTDDPKSPGAEVIDHLRKAASWISALIDSRS